MIKVIKYSWSVVIFVWKGCEFVIGVVVQVVKVIGGVMGDKILKYRMNRCIVKIGVFVFVNCVRKIFMIVMIVVQVGSVGIFIDSIRDVIIVSNKVIIILFWISNVRLVLILGLRFVFLIILMNILRLVMIISSCVIVILFLCIFLNMMFGLFLNFLFSRLNKSVIVIVQNLV